LALDRRDIEARGMDIRLSRLCRFASEACPDEDMIEVSISRLSSDTLVPFAGSCEFDSADNISIALASSACFGICLRGMGAETLLAVTTGGRATSEACADTAAVLPTFRVLAALGRP